MVGRPWVLIIIGPMNADERSLMGDRSCGTVKSRQTDGACPNACRGVPDSTASMDGLDRCGLNGSYDAVGINVKWILPI